MRRSLAVTLPVTVTIGVLLAAGLPALQASAASPGLHDGATIASPVPAKYTPNFADGAVEAISEAGGRIVVGGTFTSVSAVTAAGAAPATSRNYLMAFNPTTGALDTNFVPVLNGEVDAIVPNAAGTAVYIAGGFTTVNGIATRVALVNLSNGQLVSTFNATVNGNVNDLALVGNHLLVGGYFGYAGSGSGAAVRNGLASLDATTGAVEPYFAIQLSGHHNYGRVAGSVSSPVGAISIAVSPDQSQVIVDGNFTSVSDGVSPTAYARDQIVKIDLGDTATVDAGWNSKAFTAVCFNNGYDTYMRDIGWSPDGSYFVVTTTGGYHAGSFEHCDSASRFEGNASGADVEPTWTDYTGTDSLYSVAVTDSAVYVGGHQRWLNNPYGQDNAGSNAVARPGVAALSPATGMPLSWNPGRLRGHGAEVVYATASGVWVGSDTDYIGDYAYKHQKLAFFPFAGGKKVTPDTTGNPATIFRIGSLTATGSGLISGNSFNAATRAGKLAAPQPSNGGGINWNTVRGAFMLDGRIWYGTSAGKFYYRTFDGNKAVGPAVLVDPYNDPYWSTVQTGSNQTYKGGVNSFNAEIPNLSAMFYANNSIYYTLVNDPRLYRRTFSPDTQATSVTNQVTGGIISPVRVVAVDPANHGLANFSNVAGMFVANGQLWVAARNTGKLYRIGWNGTTITSGMSVVTTATGSWSARGVFVAPS
ncbi:MAG: hypothetical protein JWN96_944 [Mycobacterium sp.]|jgi:hypothetical protein|nr:hypothetical protein [Mycobacterium sp.]